MAAFPEPMFAISSSALRWSSLKPKAPAPAGVQAPAITPGSSTGTISPDGRMTTPDVCAPRAAAGTSWGSSTIWPTSSSTAKTRLRAPAQTTTPATSGPSSGNPSRSPILTTSSASSRNTTTGVPATSWTWRSPNASVCSTLPIGSAHESPAARTIRT